MFTKDVYIEIEKFIKGMSLGNNFLWLADMQANLKLPLYVDRVHYSAKMSEEIADRIYYFLATKALITDNSKKNSPLSNEKS